MGQGHLYIGIGLFIIFILTDAILYAFRSAMDAVNTGLIEEQKENGNKRAAYLLKMLDTPSKINDAINLVAFISNIVAGSYILDSVAKAVNKSVHSSNTLIYFVVAALIALVFLVFGVAIPENCGRRKPEKTCLRYVRIVSVIIIMLSPFIFVVINMAKIILRIFGIRHREVEDNVTEEEIITMVNEGQEQGVLEAGEAEMITNIFELGDKRAKDIMTHRSNIEAVENTITLDEFIQKHIEGKFSRFPVYEEDIDNIVGTIHIRDALILYRNLPNRKKMLKNIKGLLRKPFMLPESIDINDLLKHMQENKIHMGIVVDEYGQTCGLITMEDIIEEIVGNILDEYDDDEEAVEYAGDDTYVVDGLTSLEDINRLLGTKIESDDFETLNGYLISMLGRIANENETQQIEAFGFVFKILEVTGNVIRKVEITKKEEKESEEDE